jgi:hypothetical protein
MLRGWEYYHGTVSHRGERHGALRSARIEALPVYLMKCQLSPYERTSESIEDPFGGGRAGLAPGAGTLYSALERCFEGSEETEEAIEEGSRKARVAHFDETGACAWRAAKGCGCTTWRAPRIRRTTPFTKSAARRRWKGSAYYCLGFREWRCTRG